MTDQKLEDFFRKVEGNTNAVEVLQELQGHFGYIPQEHLKEVSRRQGIPMVTLSGVATFYTQFKLKKEGRYTISMCRG
ncbi:NAD(P)H-dependent oxidoreductase subunit E, partial [Candidatus Woesearchaeota archaeon CG_4_10_14_0_8_um_filter_47_5]